MITYNQLQPQTKALQELFINCGLEERAKSVNLQRAFNNSTFVNYAWDGAKPVGAIRCIGDGETVLYIEDILVDEAYQHKNIGSYLLQSALKTFSNVPKIVFTTEYNDSTIKFAQKFGFVDEMQYGKKTLVFMTHPKCRVSKRQGRV